MEENLISIIVPIYNAEKTIEKCLKSICEQTYTNLEIILINDGSIDRTGSICSSFSHKDSRIIVFNKRNNGVSSARNDGIRLCKGEYILFVDADDQIDNDYVLKYVTEMNRQNVDLLIGGVKIFENHKGKTLENDTTALKIIGKERIEPIICSILDVKSDLNNSYNPMSLGFPVAKLYKKEIIKDLKFREEITIREDAIFNMEALLNTSAISFFNYSGYNYLINFQSATGKFKIEYTDEVPKFLTSCKEIWKKIIFQWILILWEYYSPI